MAHTIQTTPKVASWELVCCSLYSHKERTAMLGDPPLTKRSIDEVFLFRAIMGRLFKHIDDYDDLRRRLCSGGFSTNLVALKTLPRTEAGVQEAYRRAKLALQNNNYNDEVDQDKTNDASSKKKIKNVPFWDLLKISTTTIGKPFAPESRLRKDATLYCSRGDSPQVIPPQWDGAPTDILDYDAVDNTVDHCESQNNPSETSVESTSWERICRDLYNAETRRAMLGNPPLTRRSIDEVFLFRAIMGGLFRNIGDYDDARVRLGSGGFSTNLVELKTLPRTEAGVQEAYRRAKLAFQNNNYNDEVDQDKTNDASNKKIKNVPFWDLLKISTHTIETTFPMTFRKDVTLYYCRGDSPQVIPRQWDGSPTDILDQDAADNTVDHCESQNNPSETSVESTSWERICRDLYNAETRRVMLGSPPLTKRSIDEVFLFCALMGRIFESSNACDDLWERLMSGGVTVNLSALKTLPRTETGIQEAYRRAKQAFQHDNYDDEAINNHINKINVPFMELVKIARFVPKARLRDRSTVYCSTGYLPEVDSSECDDVPFGNPPQGDVDTTVLAIFDAGNRPLESSMDLASTLDSTCSDDPSKKDLLATNTHSVDVHETTKADTRSNSYRRSVPPAMEGIKLGSQFEQSTPSGTHDKVEHLYMGIALVDGTVKVPHVRHQNKRLFLKIIIILVISAAHVLLWKFLRRDHGLTVGGHRHNPQLRGGLSMENRPRFHSFS